MDFFFFFQAEDGIRDIGVTGVQTCALPISWEWGHNTHNDQALSSRRHDTNVAGRLVPVVVRLRFVELATRHNYKVKRASYSCAVGHSKKGAAATGMEGQ